MGDSFSCCTTRGDGTGPVVQTPAHQLRFFTADRDEINSGSPVIARDRFFTAEFSSDELDEIVGARFERLMSEFFDAEDDDEFEPAPKSTTSPKTDNEIALNYGVPPTAITELKKTFPECPAALLARFLAKKSVSGDPDKAAVPIRKFLTWRSEIPNWPPAPEGLPAMFRFNGRARDGSRIFMVVPCVIDLNIPAEAYAQGLARLLLAEMKEEDTTRVTVLADVRAHQSLGYCGQPVWKLWSYISALSKVFQPNFPEIMQCLLLYPAGDVEMAAFRMLKGLLSTETIKRVKLLYDAEGQHAKAPPRELLEYIDMKEIHPGNRKFLAGLGDS